MKNNNSFKKISDSILRELILLFAPETLNTLHLASLYNDSKSKERIRKIKICRKKIYKIIIRFKENDLEYYKQLNNVQLFYTIYNKMEYLDQKELKILRDFCYSLSDKYDLRIRRDEDEEETEDQIYYKYSNIIDNIIDERSSY